MFSFLKQLTTPEHLSDVESLRAAAEKGDPEEQSTLGAMYHSGEGVQQDYAEALKWLRKAAEQGCSYNLAQLYASGDGIEKNLIEAYAWFSVEIEQGDKASEKERADVATQMDPKDLPKAVALGKSYIEKYVPIRTLLRSPPK